MDFGGTKVFQPSICQWYRRGTAVYWCFTPEPS